MRSPVTAFASWPPSSLVPNCWLTRSRSATSLSMALDSSGLTLTVSVLETDCVGSSLSATVQVMPTLASLAPSTGRSTLAR